MERNFFSNNSVGRVWLDGAYDEIISSEYDLIRGIQTSTVNFTSQEWLKDVDWYN